MSIQLTWRINPGLFAASVGLAVSPSLSRHRRGGSHLSTPKPMNGRVGTVTSLYQADLFRRSFLVLSEEWTRRRR
jgi:hypothetical protein